MWNWQNASPPTSNEVKRWLEAFKRRDFASKSEKEANELKERGNKQYNKGHYRDAFELYLKATCTAPYDSELVGISYANAAMALIQQNVNLDQALLLLDEAQRHGYPSDKLSKLEERRAACHKKLSESSTNSAPVSSARSPAQKTSESPHTLKTSIGESEKYGRFVQASVDIEPGETIVDQYEPYAACLFSSCVDTHCHHCFSRITNRLFVPCPGCKFAKYCSYKCRDISKPIHEIECRRLLFIEGPVELILCIRLLLKNALTIKEHGSSSEEYNLIRSLQTHENDYLPEDLQRMRYQVNFAMDGNPYLLEYFQPEDLYHHLLQVQTNAYAVFEVHNEYTPDTNLNTVAQLRTGLALYGYPSLFNHSCSANSVVSFSSGNLLTLRACKKIAANEQIFHSYGATTMLDYEERQAILKQKYFFTCECEACQREQLFATSLPLTDKQATEVINAAMKDAEALETRALEVLTARGEAVAEPEVETALALLHRARVLREGIVEESEREAHSKRRNAFIKSLANCNDMIGRAHALVKRYKEAIAYCGTSLKLLKTIFPEDSIELAPEHLKLASLFIAALNQSPAYDPEMTSAALQHALQAEKLFRMIYDETHEDILEAQQIKAICLHLQAEAAKAAQGNKRSSRRKK